MNAKKKRNRSVLPKSICEVLDSYKIPYRDISEAATFLSLALSRQIELGRQKDFLSEQAAEISRLEVMVGAVETEKARVEARLADEKEARRADNDRLLEIAGHLKLRLKDDDELIAQLKEMVIKLQKRVAAYKAQEKKSIKRIELLSEHREILSSSEDAVKGEQEMLQSVLDSVADVGVCSQWIRLIADDPVDTAPLPIIQTEGSSAVKVDIISQEA